MTLKLLVLFFTPLLSGLLVYLIPKGKSSNFKLILVFAGSYLFAITVIHILPELYHQPVATAWIGLFVLIGFFLQQFLEYFTAGVEHGHIHGHHHDHHHHEHHHHTHHHHETQKTVSALVLLMALCVHAFLEGGMLAHASFGPVYDVNAVLMGIALHTAPAAFALMTVLSEQLGSKSKSIPFLIGFSIAAPIGLLISDYLSEMEVLSGTAMILLYALVSGNFLHISTTIVFESSPEHHFNARKLAVAIFGSLIAVIVEYVI
jgi:zinc transporter ZupT